MKILLSIKPEYVEKILSGEKRYEYRKALHKHPNVRSAVVYATQPVGKLICEFDILETIRLTPREMWKSTSRWSGITKEFFDAYFADRQYAFALKIGEVKRFETPQDPREVFNDFVAPQSFMYLSDTVPPAQIELFPKVA